MTNDEKKIGLSLSGGGYRAAIYHLGTLKKLREMKIIDKIDFISTISGGAITGALYGLSNNDFGDFEKQLRSAVKKNVITGILFSPRFLIAAIPILAILIFIVFSPLSKGYVFILLLALMIFLLIFQFQLFPISEIINDLYAKWFFKDRKLPALRESPLVIINATNYDTGRPFIFSRNRMGDSGYDYKDDEKNENIFKHNDFPISLAVASSTCVPFAFTPIYIKEKYINDLYKNQNINPCLVDGGVFDNQGMHKLTHKQSAYCSDIIIVSGAGTGNSKKKSIKNTLKLLMSTSDAFMDRIKNAQIIRNVYENKTYTMKPIAYQCLAWNFKKCFDRFIENLKKDVVLDEVIAAHGITNMVAKGQWVEIETYMRKRIKYDTMEDIIPSQEDLKIARSVKTNLWTLKDKQIDALISQASILTELQVKLYCPSLVDINDWGNLL
jgi:NTE family protein